MELLEDLSVANFTLDYLNYNTAHAKVLEGFLRESAYCDDGLWPNTLPIDVIPSAQLNGESNMTYV